MRKWETRYQVIEPKRLENRYKVYTFEDLFTLKALKAYRAEGTSMKKRSNC
ncbi:MerR family transcriptional regulator [Metabacillus halosaccharovorans]|uniref:MerR family transcriptional regulator n=1 Tax=Metabacillus halosaccharovorans TaxID=930124 RepID=UPI000994F223